LVPLVCHARAAAARLDRPIFPAYDLLELFAFVRPARFCVPTPRGLAEALLLPLPNSTESEAAVLFTVARSLLAELTASPRLDAIPIAMAMARGRWRWSGMVLAALGGDEMNNGDLASASRAGSGLNVWTRLREWEDGPPPAPPDTWPVEPVEARARLVQLLAANAEPRHQQMDYASQAAAAFLPRQQEDQPNIALIEAGTGIGKTLGYIAPATVWAEKNHGSVWISTHTRNLQRQLDQELDRAYPDRRLKAQRVVVRKGRENQICLLNYEEAVSRAMVRKEDAVALGLVARWLLATRDGDMAGGDFPGWLADLLGVSLTLDLTDERGECIYSACRHYRRCFIERAVRRARHADIVVANHALVMAHATRGDDIVPPTRFIFDEGHHLFQAADSAFSLHLSGRETHELRQWICGSERMRGSRRRGLRRRLGDSSADDGNTDLAVGLVERLAQALPDAGWRRRLISGEPLGPAEEFLALARQQVLARSNERDPLYSLEAPLYPTSPGLIDAAVALDRAIGRLLDPLRSLLRLLTDRLDDEAATLDAGARQRIDGIRRGIERRALLPLAGWQAMLRAIRRDGDGCGPDAADSDAAAFVDWLGIDRINGQEFDVGLHRHWIDPMTPFAQTVLTPAHGALITSATLRDSSGDEEADWRAAARATGVLNVARSPIQAALPSPFDYPRQTRVIIVNDLNRDDPRQVAAAMRELFVASEGGALGLFTAINRLRGVWRLLAEPLEAAGLLLLAQHVDALDTGTLVDIFRAEENSCLLGTDALREGIDVPGRSLRLVVLDRVPWPRPTLLHRARRKEFGARDYDDRLTRMRLKQAYGRLVRRAEDRGVFVILDRALPSRLLSAFPAEVCIHRVGLAETLALVRETLHS
ncbi:MAG: ATP-dependent DNA helicase, partial [Rhodospirillales bacterium]|nr:ATP-dependent DNA helicase [Rhodospirillales bacterium]